MNDANGNTLSDTAGRSFTWDFENRLTQVVNPGVGTTTFKYDPFGRRIQKSGPLGITNYLYDWINLVEEVDGSGNVLAKYAQGPGIDQPFAEIRNAIPAFYQQDGLGSATSLTDTSGGVGNTYTYDSFGNTIASAGNLINPFRYTGREFDQETSLFYYRARYYDPTIGRFTTEDPLGFGGNGPNVYKYVNGNPINRTDSRGLSTWEIYGYWCGPGWTGGMNEPFNPQHWGQYQQPLYDEPVDEACMHHDICYFMCRHFNPCNPGARSKCFRNCDWALLAEIPRDRFWGNVVFVGIFLHFKPNPESNLSCGCYKVTPLM